MLDFDIITDETGKSFAVDKEGTFRFCIQKDKSGEYFYVDNIYNVEGDEDTKELFCGRIADAVKTVFAGDGDVIEKGSLFGQETIRVRYYIDRTVGEPLRQQTMEGWKDVEFKYAIQFGSVNSSFGFRQVVDIDGTSITPFDVGSVEPLMFDTESEAKEFINEVWEECNYIYTKIMYKGLDFHDYYRSIQVPSGRTNIKLDVVSRLLADEGYDPKEYVIEPVQVVATTY